MQISSILDYIDNGHMALPEFQRGYVWGREQVRKLFQSLYRGHPVGSLLVWATDASTAAARGDGKLAPGVVKLLLDGQQRITSLYGVIRGKPPRFFDGNAKAFTDLRFNLATEEFEFFQPIKMRDDPLWIDVTEVMKKGNAGVGAFVTALSQNPDNLPRIGDYLGRMNQLLGIRDKAFHIEEVTGADKTLDVVVDIFNRVNSGGTKLSKGDLALAKICADWPEARDTMKSSIARWRSDGYDFSLDWLLRSVNTILTGEAKFLYLHTQDADSIADALKRAVRHIDTTLNMIGGRLGLDHDRVLFSKFAIPVMVRYLDSKGGKLNERTRDRLLFWYVQTGMWGRFSGSVESFIDKDLGILDETGGDLDKLIAELRLSQGGLRVEPGHFHSWSVGARFYPVLYMLTRMTEARDWGTGLPLKNNLLGKMNRLEVHHIFPRARLYEADFARSEVNALANFCFLTKDTNLSISDRRPEEYLPQIEADHPGALWSQWIPQDPLLWRIENYRDFLEARKDLLAEAAPQGRTLATRVSDPLTVILRDMLKFSTNLTAEMVGLAATRARTGRLPTSLAASATDMTRWAETTLGLSGHRFDDHSGLSESSRITPAGMVRALLTPTAQAALPALLKDVAMRNAKGQPVKAHPLKVVAKTGTLNFASTLGGYITTPNGTRLAFAVFSVDPAARARISPENRENAPGAAPWNTRAKALQQGLIDVWGNAPG